MGALGCPASFGFTVECEERGEHLVGLIDQARTHIVSGVDKAGFEAAHGAIDDRGAFGRRALFKGE